MIQHKTARRIACEWHGGGGSALYVLCSTGAIDTGRNDHNAAEEINEGIEYHRVLQGDVRYSARRKMAKLSRLLAYVQHYGPRGQVDGWGDMTW